MMERAVLRLCAWPATWHRVVLSKFVRGLCDLPYFLRDEIRSVEAALTLYMMSANQIAPVLGFPSE